MRPLHLDNEGRLFLTPGTQRIQHINDLIYLVTRLGLASATWRAAGYRLKAGRDDIGHFVVEPVGCIGLGI